MVRSWGQRDFALADERDWGEIRRSFEHEALVPSTQRTALVGSRITKCRRGEMADARDLKSLIPKGVCGFESRRRHWLREFFSRLRFH